MKRVVVTGCLGSVSSNLIRILNKKKFYVINIYKIHILLIKKISQLIFRITNFIKKILIINILKTE
jgi:hypothetical protein